MTGQFALSPPRSLGALLTLGLAIAGSQANAAPGLLTVQAGVEFASTAFLEIELAGLAPGSQFDRLEVGGDLVINGELRLALLGSFFPEPEDSFVVISAPAISGTFTNEAQGRVTLADGSGTMSVTYQPTTVTLSDFVSLTLLFRDGFENE